MMGHVHDIVAPLLPKAVPQIFIPAAAVIGILFAIFTWWRGAPLYEYAPVLPCLIALVPRPSARRVHQCALKPSCALRSVLHQGRCGHPHQWRGGPHLPAGGGAGRRGVGARALCPRSTLLQRRACTPAAWILAPGPSLMFDCAVGCAHVRSRGSLPRQAELCKSAVSSGLLCGRRCCRRWPTCRRPSRRGRPPSC